MLLLMASEVAVSGRREGEYLAIWQDLVVIFVFSRSRACDFGLEPRHSIFGNIGVMVVLLDRLKHITYDTYVFKFRMTNNGTMKVC